MHATGSVQHDIISVTQGNPDVYRLDDNDQVNAYMYDKKIVITWYGTAYSEVELAAHSTIPLT